MIIERLPNGTYSHSLPPSILVIKKPVPIEAREMKEEFFVKTSLGIQSGNIGDWLLTAQDGTLYPFPKEYFERSYSRVTEDDY